MKKLISKATLLISLLLTLSSTSFAQIDTAAVYRAADKISGSKTKYPEIAAMYLASDYTDEGSKVVAISYWITKNIAYDYKSFEERRNFSYNSDEVLKRRKALCGEYAQLFKEMCQSVGLKAEVVGGYTRGMDFLANDTLFRSEHAWNVVRIDGQWQLIDLTWAAGSVMPAKQAFKKITLGTFGVPYKPKFKFVKKYHPEYLFADPRKFIKHHLPELSMYQLLKFPISSLAFEGGEKMVSSFLAEDASLDLKNTQLNHIINKPNLDKILFTGDGALKENRFNNRARAFACLTALDSLYTKHYDEKTKTVIGEKAVLQQMKRLATLSDSLLKQTTKDIDQEFFQLQKRSERWKESVKVNNKIFINEHKARIRQNNINIKFAAKSRFKAVSMSEFMLTRYYQFKLMPDLSAVRRPKTPDPAAAKQSQLLLHQQDSLWRLIALSQLVEIDKLHEFYNVRVVTDKANMELPILSIYEANQTLLRMAEEKKQEGFSLIHNDPTYLSKDWMRKNIDIANEMKLKHTDKMMEELYNNQTRFFELVKEYAKTSKERLNMIKTAKKGSGDDQKEDSLHQEVIKRFTGDMLDFQAYLKTYVAARGPLKHYTKEQNKLLNKLSKRLQKESDFENFRHQAYMDYRKEIRISESDRVKLATKTLNQYNSAIDRGWAAVKGKK